VSQEGRRKGGAGAGHIHVAAGRGLKRRDGLLFGLEPVRVARYGGKEGWPGRVARQGGQAG